MTELPRVRFYDNDRHKAGFGLLSDGIPLSVGQSGESEKVMPPPVGTRCRLQRDTVPMRKVRP